MDANDHHCYLEMISLLFGESVMMKIRDENQISLAGQTGDVVHIKKVDFEKLELTPQLKNQMELKLQ